MSKADADGWIEWQGGECPVPGETKVGVRFCDGRIGVGIAVGWLWTPDIVAYRVVPPVQLDPDPDKPDMVNHPPHYTDGEIETIDYLRAKLGAEGFTSYCIGNALKYLSRAGKKGDLREDVAKAAWYLDRVLKEAEA